jgi:peroxiredoxin
MKQNKALWISLAALVGGGICLVVCAALIFAAGVIYGFMPLGDPLAVGAVAPDFELTTLSGQVIHLSQFRGQPVVVSIGATWCPDCRREAPILQNLHETYPDLVVLSVDSREDAETVQAFADEFGLTFPIALDHDGEVLQSYGVIAIPTLFFVDSEGVIQARMVEGVSEKKLDESLATIGVTP